MFFFSSPAFAGGEDSPDKWRVSLYRGRWSKTIFIRIVFRHQTDFRDSWLSAAAAGRNILSLGDLLNIEGELNFGKHYGMQNHAELNGLLSLRWNKFPWDRYLDTSIAYGSGISWAFERPAIERRSHTPDPARLLKFMMLEIELRPPPVEQWGVFMRVHHRSGVFGLVRENQGSNIVALGLRGFF